MSPAALSTLALHCLLHFEAIHVQASLLENRKRLVDTTCSHLWFVLEDDDFGAGGFSDVVPVEGLIGAELFAHGFEEDGPTGTQSTHVCMAQFPVHLSQLLRCPCDCSVKVARHTSEAEEDWGFDGASALGLQGFKACI